MKKLLFFFLILLTASGQAQPKEAALLQEFLDSPDYAAFVAGSVFSQHGTVDIRQSFVEYSKSTYEGTEKEIPVLYLQLVNTKGDTRKITGQIQAVKVKADTRDCQGVAGT